VGKRKETGEQHIDRVACPQANPSQWNEAKKKKNLKEINGSFLSLSTPPLFFFVFFEMTTTRDKKTTKFEQVKSSSQVLLRRPNKYYLDYRL